MPFVLGALVLFVGVLLGYSLALGAIKTQRAMDQIDRID